MVTGFVRGKAGSVFLTGAILVGLVLVARHFKLGSTIKAGAFELGQAGGDVITQPIAGLTNSLSAGINNIAKEAQELFGSLGSAGADVQEAFTGNRDAIGDFFAGGSDSDGNAGNFTPSSNPNAFSVARVFTPESIATRRKNVNTARFQVKASGSPAPFGGFGTFQAQESALQKAINASRAQFPQFFR